MPTFAAKWTRRQMLAAVPVALSASALRADESFPPPESGDFGAPSLLLAPPQETRLRHLGWPKIVRARDGGLFVFCLAGMAHTKMGSPAWTVSRDHGHTWAPLRVLRYFGGEGEWKHSGNVAAGLADDGALVVLAMAMNADSSRTAIFGWRSADGGASWTECDTSALTGSVYGHVFHVPGKGLAVTGHFRAGALRHQQGIWIAFSKDHGRTWQQESPVTRGPHVEPAILYTSRRFYGLVRITPPDRYIQVISEDQGHTWKESDAFVGTGANLPSPSIAVDPNDPERIWVLHTDRRPPGLERGQITLWSANLNRLEWTNHGVVSRHPLFPGNDFGYPWMSPIDGRNYQVVFYHGTGTVQNALWGVKLKLPKAH